MLHVSCRSTLSEARNVGRTGDLSPNGLDAYGALTMNYDNQRPWGAPPGGAAAVRGRASLVSEALWVTYRWMAAGLAVTGLVAMLVANSRTALELIVGNRIVF